MFLLSFIYIIYEFINKRYLLNFQFILFLIIFIAGILGSLTVGYFNTISIFKIAQNLMLVSILIIFSRGEDVKKSILLSILLGGLSSVVSGFIFEGMHSYKRFAGITGNPNGFGQISGQAILAGVGLILLSKRKIIKAIYLIFGIICLIGFFYSGSRGATIALAISSLTLNIKNRIKYLIILFIITTAIIFTHYTPKIFIERWKQIKINRLTESLDLRYRIFLMRQGWELFKKYPIFGVGFGNSVKVMKEIDINNPRVTHNFVVQTLAEIGLIGTLAFLLIYFKTAKIFIDIIKNNKNNSNENIIALTFFSLFIFISISHLFSGNYIHTIWYIFFSLGYTFKEKI